MSMRVMIIGDIVGRMGKRAVQSAVHRLRIEFNCSLCIANGENIAGGAGLSESACEELHNRGVDVITSGDHVWDQKDFIGQIQDLPYVLRPANLPPGQPGRGYALYDLPDGGQFCVINLLGQIFMRIPADCPFHAADRIVEEVRPHCPRIFVDMHAEATSEKIAMGRYLEGRVTAVFGTHTHVPTADEQVFPGGTAYITDVGMVGSRDSILGREIEPVLHRFTTGIPARFTVAEDNIEIHGVVVELESETGRAISIHRFIHVWKSE